MLISIAVAGVLVALIVRPYVHRLQRGADGAPGDRWIVGAGLVLSGSVVTSVAVTFGMGEARFRGAGEQALAVATIVGMVVVAPAMFVYGAAVRRRADLHARQVAEAIGQPVRRRVASLWLIAVLWWLVFGPALFLALGLVPWFFAQAWGLPATPEQAVVLDRFMVRWLMAVGFVVIAVAAGHLYAQHVRRVRADRDYASARQAAGLPGVDPTSIRTPLETLLEMVGAFRRPTSS
jgi:hypothetical protein